MWQADREATSNSSGCIGRSPRNAGSDEPGMIGLPSAAVSWERLIAGGSSRPSSQSILRQLTARLMMVVKRCSPCDHTMTWKFIVTAFPLSESPKQATTCHWQPQKKLRLLAPASVAGLLTRHADMPVGNSMRPLFLRGGGGIGCLKGSSIPTHPTIDESEGDHTGFNQVKDAVFSPQHQFLGEMQKKKYSPIGKTPPCAGHGSPTQN